MKRLVAVLLMIGVLCLPLLVTAQDDTIRELYVVTAFGDPVFEIDRWRLSATESVERTTATWSHVELSAVGYADYLHFDDGYEPDLERYFDDTWFSETFVNYDSYTQTAFCFTSDSTGNNSGTLLWEFDVSFGDEPYLMRYWVQPITPTRVLALFIVFPVDEPDLMNRYAARFQPELSVCKQ
jgi:hypothetical protein